MTEHDDYPCQCGRGPILRGNMVPEVCMYCFAERFCADCGEPLTTNPDAVSTAMATVKRATLFDGVIDTYQTETELNGFRATQGALL